MRHIYLHRKETLKLLRPRPYSILDDKVISMLSLKQALTKTILLEPPIFVRFVATFDNGNIFQKN